MNPRVDEFRGHAHVISQQMDPGYDPPSASLGPPVTASAAYGDAEIRVEAGRPVVVRADPVIGMSLELLATAGEHLPVDADGCILLAGDPHYRYRPVRFAGVMAEASGPCRVLVCERVP